MYPYSLTYADVGAAPNDICWRLLRALRAHPPGNAGGKRHAMFASALEQSEQLFAAAETVGPATRPILLFYGLSQAGRALSAALSAEGADWKLAGHGIRQDRSVEPDAIADSRVVPSKTPTKPGKKDTGSFTRIVEVLRSSSLPGVTRLADLWPLIRPTYKFPLTTPGAHQLIPMSIGSRSGVATSGSIHVDLSELPAALHYGEVDSPSGVRGDWIEQARDVRAFLSQYPTLNKCEFLVPDGQPIGVRLDPTGTARVTMQLRHDVHSQFETSEDLERHLVYRDGGHRCAYPTLDGSDRPIHPIVVWWAVLFGLSTIARYEPEQWARAIDVNQSVEAVPIEHLLQCALDNVPELIHRALVGLS